MGLVLSDSRFHFSSGYKQLHSLSSLAHLCRGSKICNAGIESVSPPGESETHHVTS